MEKKADLKLAVTIDADNIPSEYIKNILEEIAKYGSPTFKRIYGDWTKPNLTKWKSVLLEHAITPIQQYSYTSGKNSTDSAMIIDAMDILYAGKVGGFCIISSDSDFTRLALRLRESGMIVFGFGEKKTPYPFIAACDKFIYLEILHSEEEDNEIQTIESQVKEPSVQKSIHKINSSTIALIAASVDDIADDDGWAFLGDVGNMIMKKKPDFDPRNYGFLKLTPLIKSLKSHFDIDERQTTSATIKHVYIKTKKKKYTQKKS
jgi:uncharacterized LabA/DUF88 family protein